MTSPPLCQHVDGTPSNRRKCAFFLRDLVAAADLPPHSALFSQQHLHLTHKWWAEREDTDIDINDIHFLAGRSLHSHEAAFCEVS